MAKKSEEPAAEPEVESPKPKKAEKPLDETVPGGRYVNAAGETVNAEGEKIK